MARALDLARLREQTIGSNGDEEAVTVNTRALIDKVLARYSGDWTTLRELIQNAADALATKVVIRFETLPSKTVPVPSTSDESELLKHTLRHHTAYRLVVSNNGQAFKESDWNRLKRIAEGNPDESKIGAFGVGFYSVFADCEEPFVISGTKTMAFLWKGNSLYTKAATVSSDQTNDQTTFLLNYRSTTSPLPGLTSLCQFLSTSLTFVGLDEIELWLDQWNVLTLHKKQAPAADAQLPANIKTRTQERIMKIVGVVHQNTQIDARWMNIVAWTPPSSNVNVTVESSESGPTLRSLFSRLTTSATSVAAKKAAREAEVAAQQKIAENLSATSSATAFLRISTVNVQTSVTSTFAQELERATKKPPPKHTRIAILTSSHDEATASLSTMSGLTANKAKELFASVVPTRHGRIFIGFPTAQTTGLLCHISAPSVIPTVERESIDLNARYVRTWNVEMLRVAGIACRIAYSGELTVLKQKIDAAAKSAGRTPSKAEVDGVMDQTVHVLRQYTAAESTPSSQVGKIIEEAFWSCSESKTIEILSTKGVLPSNRVRVVSEPLSFLGEIAVVPSELAKRAEDFIRRLYDNGLISDMTIKDIKTELETRSLDEDQLVEFFKWISTQLKNGSLDETTIKNLLASTIVTMAEKTSKSDSGSEGGQILILGNMSTYLSGSKIPPDMPLPPTTLPFKFSKVLPAEQLSALGFDELQIVPWVTFLLDGQSTKALPSEECLDQSPEFAARVLGVLSKRWDHVSASSRSSLIDLLSNITCVPTKLGMRRPVDAYFASVKLFDDLPTVTGLTAVRDKVLAALGVRKTIELSYVFDRLMNPVQQDGKSTWSFFDLVQYLASVREDIPARDIERLRSTAFCPLETETQQSGRPQRLFRVSEVFEPRDVFRKMGLPILQWHAFYRFGSPEAKFLTFLGIKQFPTVMELVKIMVQSAAQKKRSNYDLAINYFNEHYHTNGYGRFDLTPIKSIPFLLSTAQSFPALVAPGECFSNERAAIMGYHVIAADLRPNANQFGVRPDPPMIDCVQRLQADPPKTHQRAVEVFGYFAGRLAEVNGPVAQNLGNLKMVPITTKGEKEVFRLISPKSCFLGDPSTYGDILDFVDFGQEANSFLLKIGSKPEPSSLELAWMVAKNPAKLLGVLEEKRYVELLRKLAENKPTLKNDKILWKDLKKSPCLLAYKDVPSNNEEKRNSKLDRTALEDFDDDDGYVKTHMLRKASDIVIVDTIKELLMFREAIAQAPQDDTLEMFYQDLGVPTLSSLIELSNRMGSVQRDQNEAEQLRKLVIERSKLFLHEYNQGVRHDFKWLEVHLDVATVDSLYLTYILKGYDVPSVREKMTATMTTNKGKDRDHTLYITRHPDLYEVAQWLCRILLTRPKQHDILALEMVLSSDLRRLRTKGYNVDRILRQREYETRLAEEQKRKADEERRRTEQESLAEREATLPQRRQSQQSKSMVKHEKTASQAESESTSMPKIPGAFNFDFPESDNPKQIAPLPPPPSGNKAVGANSMFSSAQEWAKQLGGQFSGQQPSGNSQSTSTPSGQTNQPQQANPNSSEKNVARNLGGAIQASRAFNSSQLFTPPKTTNVEESKGSYCDEQAAQDISFAIDSAAGIKVFLANHIADKAGFLAKHTDTINTFGFILLDVSSVFNIAPQALHIFYDTQGATIAFNSGGSLFFNYHWFEQLHLPNFATSRDAQIGAVAYWWIVFCHELAHNLVKDHSAQHSFYAESFAQQYFGKVMQKALQY